MKQKLCLVALCLPLFFVQKLNAQFDKMFPRNPDYQEFTLLGEPKPPVSEFTSPPSSPVRTMAEWEELQGLLIAWTSYPDILAEITKAARLETNVLILCSSASVVSSAKTKLTAHNVDYSSNVQFIIGDYNTIWCRDYGPHCVYTNDVDSLLLIDWIYNRPRPKDDKVPQVIGTTLNLPVYSTSTAPLDLVHTGGNFMSDGQGTAFSSKLFLNENDGTGYGTTVQSEAALDSIMKQFMGIKVYPKMETLPYDGIHHIDMHMKLLDEETILVSKYPTGTADGPQIEANIQYVLSNYKTVFGTDFKIVWIIAPPGPNGKYPNNNGDYRTYSNAVFVNKTVIIPTYEQKYDTTAIKIWQQQLPGYNIVGIPCNDIITQLGAIHCITHEIGVNDPLMILHHKYNDCVQFSQSGYPISAKIKHKTGISEVNAFYKISNATDWIKLPMNLTSPDQFEAVLPSLATGNVVEYYIEATATSGKKMARPMPAPAGFWKFEVCEPLAVSEQNLVEMQPIFPNPAHEITCIPIFSTKKTHSSVRVFDIVGRLVSTIFDGEMNAGDSKLFLDAGQLSAGVYFIELRDGQHIQTQRFVVR